MRKLGIVIYLSALLILRASLPFCQEESTLKSSKPPLWKQAKELERNSFFYTVLPGDTLSGLARKYGTSIEFLQRSNGISGDRIFVGMKLKVVRVEFSILIKKRHNLLILFANGKPIRRYRVATGEKGSTPVGVFKIVNKLKNPTWFHAGLVLPPESPQNILGSRWLGFDNSGYGIHGTTLPDTIGTQSSKGCIRMLNSNVEEIYDLIPQGSRVVVEE